MPTGYEIDSKRRAIVVTVRGELRDEDLLGIYERFRTEPKFDPDFGLLIDLRSASGRSVRTTDQTPPPSPPSSGSARANARSLGSAWVE